MPKLSASTTGRHPKVSGEGTRGKQGTGDGAELWGFRRRHRRAGGGPHSL